MNKRTKNRLIRVLLAFALSLVTCVGVFALATENPTAGLQGELKATVKLGEEVHLPEYYAEIDSEVKKTIANVIFPSGTVYAGSKFVASEAGNYSINYLYNGKVVHSEYCKAIVGAKDLISVNNFAVVDGIKNYAYGQEMEELTGVAVDVYGGANIEFNQAIAVSSLEKNSVLFEAIVEPTTKGDADFTKMYITFSDANNPDNYFRVTVTDGHADGDAKKEYVYINAGANGQTSGGYSYNDDKNPVWQSVDIYGTSTVSSFRAEKYKDFSNYTIKLFFDAEENALYVARWFSISLVADFDDSVIFNGTEWGGFTSDTIKVSVSFGDVAVNGGRVIFNQIGGVRLNQEEIIDDVAPTLTIDLEGQSKAPNCTLGTQYKIFNYKTYDFYDPFVKVGTSVTYKNVATGSVTDVSVVDGKFTTDKLGIYTIKYVATDYSGNKTEKELSFECVGKADEIVLTKVPEDYSATIFDTVSITSPDVIRAYGGLGNLTVEANVVGPDGNLVNLENDEFFAEKVGQYVITYIATDYFGKTASKQVVVTVNAEDKTIFDGEMGLPNTLVKGFNYVVSQVFAKTCFNGVVENCQIKYYVDETLLDEDRSFKAEGTSLTVKCVAFSQNGTVRGEKSARYDVVDGQNGKDQTAYFIDKESKVQISDSQTTINFKTSEDSSVEFVNVLNGYSFALGVSYDAQKINFSSFDVVLTDARNASISVTLKFTIKADGVSLSVPFGATANFTTTGGYFKVNVSFDERMVSDVDGKAITSIQKDDLGNDLSVFEYGLYAKFVFSGVYDESEISFDTLNNQTLGYRTEEKEDAEDDKGPEIEVTGEINLKAQVGDSITIYSAKAYDVLSQVKSITVRVLNPAGEEILAETSASQDLTIALSESGEYMIIYTAFDTANARGNRTRLISNVRVINSTPPTLEVKFKDVIKRVGGKVKIPKITVSDDTGVVYYDVFLFMPNSEMRLLVHYDNGEITSYLSKTDDKYPPSFKVSDKKFKLEQKGTYKLIVMAYDEYYNLTIKSFTILAK